MKTAIVTGAASGIGAETKKRLEKQGYKTIGIDLKNTEICADLSTNAGRQSAIDQALELSGGKIDRLVLAAGLGGHIENGQLVAKVNYFGTVVLLEGLQSALEATKGRCVVIGSNTAQLGADPSSPMITAMLEEDEAKTMEIIADAHAAMVYGSTKHAVTRAVRRRAADLGAKGVTINVIAPGPTDTPMLQGVKDHPVISQSLNAIPIPKVRFGRLDEVVDVIEFMLSDSAEYMQGSVIYVDGGTDAQIRPDAF